MARTDGEQMDGYGFEDPEEVQALRAGCTKPGAERGPQDRTRCRGFHGAERLSDRETGAGRALRGAWVPDGARTRRASEGVPAPGGGQKPRSDGGATVAPPSGASAETRNRLRSWPGDETRTRAGNASAICGVGRARQETQREGRRRPGSPPARQNRRWDGAATVAAPSERPRHDGARAPVVRHRRRENVRSPGRRSHPREDVHGLTAPHQHVTIACSITMGEHGHAPRATLHTTPPPHSARYGPDPPHAAPLSSRLRLRP